MPQSRKRKPRRGGASARNTYSSKKKSNLTGIIIAVAIVAALAIGAVVFLTSGGDKTGVEITTPSGLKYIDEVIGSGPRPALGKTVTVQYTGTLENGTKFDSSLDSGQPLVFRIGTGAVIKGWDEGIMTMKVGGKRRLIVPPELAYGAIAKPSIPANSTLFFEVELLNVK